MLVYGAFGLGALCMLLGFFTVVRGIGAADSATTVKMFGIEFSASKLGPGLVFSVLGLILVVVAVSLQAKPASNTVVEAPAATAQTNTAPAAAAVPAAAPPSLASNPRSTPSGAATASQIINQLGDNPQAQGVSHEDAAELLQATLLSISQGVCPADALEPLPYTQCMQSGALLRQQLIQAGPIRNVSYNGKYATQAGPVDQFMVTFQNGQVLWKAAVTSNRKFAALWYGPP